jgi:uncharacterized protein YbjT (DUF2867 family)
VCRFNAKTIIFAIYGEVQGEEYRSVLDPYRHSAALIEASDLDYTILRPGWFTHEPEAPFISRRRASPFEDTTSRSTACPR